MKIRLAFCIGLSMIVAGCAGSVTPPTSASEVQSEPDRYSADAGAAEDYRLGIGDKVRATVYNEPTLSGDFSVSADGTLALPLIGTVQVSGQSPRAVAALVQQRLGDGYLRDPKVSMEVITYRPFFILGEVKTPGQYPYASGLTVMNAIATAEGFTPRSNRKMVFIRRSGTSMEKAFRLSPELRVLPGDTIRLGERYF